MEVGDCLYHFPDHLLGGAFIEFALSMELGEELPIRGELEHQIDVLAIVEGIVQLDDVLVVQLSADLDFVVQLRYHVLDLHFLLRNSLQGELLSRLLVHCAVHYSKSSSALKLSANILFRPGPRNRTVQWVSFWVSPQSFIINQIRPQKQKTHWRVSLMMIGIVLSEWRG